MVLSTPAIVFSVCALFSAVLSIWSVIKSSRRLHLIAKPLTTGLIIAVAALAAVPAPSEYKTFVLAGLVFSLLATSP